MLYRLRRSSLAWWSCVCLVAILGALLVRGEIADANHTRDRYGTLSLAWIAARPIPAGSVVEQNDVVHKAVPRSLLPEDYSKRPPLGQAVRTDIAPNEVIIEMRLAPRGLRGAAALLPTGKRAIGVVPSAGTPKLHIGDEVNVLANFENDQSQPTLELASRSEVLEVRSDVVTIAVTPAQSAKVAYAITQGSITLVLTN